MIKKLEPVEKPDVDFNGMVTSATWMIIEGIARGTKLRDVVYSVVVYAQWWENQTKAHKEYERLLAAQAVSAARRNKKQVAR